MEAEESEALELDDLEVEEKFLSTMFKPADRQNTVTNESDLKELEGALAKGMDGMLDLMLQKDGALLEADKTEAMEKVSALQSFIEDVYSPEHKYEPMAFSMIRSYWNMAKNM